MKDIFALPLAITSILSMGMLQANPNQLFNLNEEKPDARFEVSEISWPGKPGEAEICLWKDDKLAAISLSVDDNAAIDIPWWREKTRQYNVPVTWFIITSRVGTGGFWGQWRDFIELEKDPVGHAVESHTVMHLHVDRPEWKGIEWEYSQAIKDIEKNIPGKKVSVLAYPGGKNSGVNDRELAATMYRAARGGRGTPNQANQIDYLNINGMSSINVGDTEKGAWGDVYNLVDKSRYRGMFYRGWAVYLQHGVKDEQKAVLQKLFEFIEEHRDQLWVGLFVDVAKYGQQRDTATLKTLSANQSEIKLELTDRMDDRYFDYPLTVKVRLYDSWQSVSAIQNGQPVEVSVVQHGGKPYALVQIVPDRGVTTLVPR